LPQINLALSAAAFAATLRLVPPVRAATLRRGLFGLDINKRGTPAGTLQVRACNAAALPAHLPAPADVAFALAECQVPEAVGLAPGAAFMGAAILFQWAQFAEGCACSLSRQHCL
jgi:hypothetical protein